MEKNNINRKEFMKLFLNDQYIKWLYDFTKENEEFNDLYFVKNNVLDEFNKLMIRYLKYLYYELCSFCIRYNDEEFETSQVFGITYKDFTYVIYYDGECFGLIKYIYYKPSLIVEYEQLKKKYNIEYKCNVNNIQTTPLELLIDNSLENPTEFYKSISKQLTPEERLFIMDNLENKTCENCLNKLCYMDKCEKGIVDTFEKNEAQNCCGWYNDELVGRSKVLKKY